MRRVLFLDFDGVLHHAQGTAVPEFSLAPLLADAMSGRDCDIVVSSTWREHHPVDRLRSFLPASLAARVVDVLGPDHRGPFVRQKNILAWLSTQEPLVEWRALDDAACEFSVGCPELILCDGATGLRGEQCAQLQSWLDSLTAADPAPPAA